MKVALVAVPAMDVVDAAGDAGGHGRARPVGADSVRACPPYGVYLLAGVLGDAGHEVVVVDLVASGTGQLDPCAVVDLSDVDLVGVSATSLAWSAARQVIARVRVHHPEIPIVVGGVHPSLFDRHVLASSEADAVVRGDGEQALLALCRAVEAGDPLDGVPSLTWRARDGVVVRNAPGPPVTPRDLEAGFPAYDQLPVGAYVALALETSRGCPHACVFCATPHRRSWRACEAGGAVARLARLQPLLDRVLMPWVYLVDDEFTARPARAAAIADGLSEAALDIGLLYDARAPDLLRSGVVEALGPHTRSLLVGAECGYDEGLARVGKGTTCGVVRQAAARLAAAGLAARAEFSFILGLPWEGAQEMCRTVDFAFGLAEEHGVRPLLNWYVPMPGSDLWEEARAGGATSAERYDHPGVTRDPAVLLRGRRMSEGDVEAVAAHVERRQDRLGAAVPRPWFKPPLALAS